MEKAKNKYKILLTGGHAATTAISVVEEIKSQKLDWKLYFVGSKNAIEGTNILTLEYESLPKLRVTFLPLTMGRLQRRFTLWTIPSILKIPVGFAQSLYYLIRIRPNITLSFGGFSSFPIVLCSKLLGIPVILHEQTAAAGRANLASSKFVDKIALARDESSRYFPSRKVVTTGNPVMKKILSVKNKYKTSSPPTIYITGGSRGSQSINDIVGVILPQLLKDYKVIHQTGGLDLDRFEKIKDLLPANLAARYHVFARINPLEIADFYEMADLIISRAGANTVSDILASKRPAILIPLPISYLDEQTKNAEFLAEYGFAKIIPQNDLTAESLLAEIKEIFSNYAVVIKKVSEMKSPDQNAAKQLVSLLKEYLR